MHTRTRAQVCAYVQGYLHSLQVYKCQEMGIEAAAYNSDVQVCWFPLMHSEKDGFNLKLESA